uniref:Uncharacterized protein n=1 Tax=Caenorhabditis japonica TaxID=281687 RepID=A0A8R1HR96_CAEJA
MRSKIDTKTDLTDWVSTFVLEAPADDRVLYAKIEVNHLNATISNEVLSYLSAFVNDEDAPRSTVRLVVHVHNSNIHIVDSKKSKPFRLKIKSLSIEQEED